MSYRIIFKSILNIFLISALLIAFELVPKAYGHSHSHIEGCPEFNCDPQDLELLVLYNKTKENGWHDPISADCGDKVAFQVYYHNCVEDTVAEGTKIRIDYPDIEDTSLESTAYLWAENVSYVSDTGTINISTPQKLVFDDTAKWYPDQSSTSITIPVTEYYRSVEVNIGDIEGGWAHQGYVTFEATVTDCQIPMPSVDLKANNSDGPITVSYKSNVNLSWNSENASSCEASGDWSGIKAVSGSQTIQMNEVRTHNFTLTCQDSTGSKTQTDSVTVEVTPIPPTVITLPAVVTY